MKNVLVVFKKSAYELYMNSPDEEVQEFMRTKEQDVASMKRSHDEQKRTLDVVTNELMRTGVHVDTIYRADLSPILDRDLVVSVGGDGTFLEVAHYVDTVPILGVNSSPGSSVGFYCCSNADTFSRVLDSFGDMPRTHAERLALRIDGKIVPELVLNDVLYAHPNPAAMSRYQLRIDDAPQVQLRDSGLLVCTAVGSSAWMYNEGGEEMPIESELLQYRQRGMRSPLHGYASALDLRSITREGRLYIDGQHLTYALGLGSTVSFRRGKPLTIIGDIAEKRSHNS